MLNLFEAAIAAGLGAYLFRYDYTQSQVLLANSKLAVEIQRAEKNKPKLAQPAKSTVPAQISM